jgi:hypothetical protein
VGAYRGDTRGDLWLLLESGLAQRAWAATDEARLASRWIVLHFEELGWSTKRESGWERLLPGDQLVAMPPPGWPAALRVRGRFRHWEMVDSGRTRAACSAREGDGRAGDERDGAGAPPHGGGNLQGRIGVLSPQRAPGPRRR